jgi:hypothetical protein
MARSRRRVSIGDEYFKTNADEILTDCCGIVVTASEADRSPISSESRRSGRYRLETGHLLDQPLRSRFGGNSATNFSFPFMVNYSTDLDPQSIVLSSLLGKPNLSNLAIVPVLRKSDISTYREMRKCSAWRYHYRLRPDPQAAHRRLRCVSHHLFQCIAAMPGLCRRHQGMHRLRYE